MIELEAFVGDLGRVDIMSDHQQCDVQLLFEAFEKVEYLIGSIRIKVTRRLVGDDDFWVSDDGSGDAHSLLLSA